MESGRTRDLIESSLPLIVILTLFFLAFSTLEPFMPALVWGVILAVALQPFHRSLVERLHGRRSLATLLISLLMILLLVLPMLGLSQALIKFLPELLRWASETTATFVPPEVNAPARQAPAYGGALWQSIRSDLEFIRTHFATEIKPAAFWLIGEAKLIGTFVLEFAIGVALAAFLLHRSTRMGSAFADLSERVAGPLGRKIAVGTVGTIRSTVFGFLGSAGVQTALAAISYWFVGAPHWPVLALLTFLLAMIQIGPILIWAPLAFWLWSGGETVQAIGLVLWGLIVVGLADNVIKTVTVSRGAEIPSLLAFLGAFGGLIAWGIVGLFLGPVVIAICYQVTMHWVGAGTSTDELTEV